MTVIAKMKCSSLKSVNNALTKTFSSLLTLTQPETLVFVNTASGSNSGNRHDQILYASSVFLGNVNLLLLNFCIILYCDMNEQSSLANPLA